MKTVHSFEIKNKTSITPTGLLGKYQEATLELIARLKKKGYEVLITRNSYFERGVPNGIIVIADKKISLADIKDDFRTIVRDIKDEKKLGFKFWNFELGEIYEEIK